MLPTWDFAGRQELLFQGDSVFFGFKEMKEESLVFVQLEVIL